MGFFDLHPALSIFIVSFGITLIITLAYKYLTNQKEMKELKLEMKSMQKEMKTSKDDPKKMMAINKKMMAKNMKYMKQSFKPTLYTFLPIILIFAWFNGHIAYEPLTPGQDFTTMVTMAEGSTGDISLQSIPTNPELPENIIVSSVAQPIQERKAMWRLNAPQEGRYVLRYTYDNRTYDQEVLITTEQEYEQPLMKIKKAPVKLLQVNNEKVKPLGNINIFGWTPGWFAYYFIITIIMSTLLRKLLKIY